MINDMQQYIGLVIRCNISPRHSSKVISEDKLPVVILM